MTHHWCLKRDLLSEPGWTLGSVAGVGRASRGAGGRGAAIRTRRALNAKRRSLTSLEGVTTAGLQAGGWLGPGCAVQRPPPGLLWEGWAVRVSPHEKGSHWQEYGFPIATQILQLRTMAIHYHVPVGQRSGWARRALWRQPSWALRPLQPPGVCQQRAISGGFLTEVPSALVLGVGWGLLSPPCPATPPPSQQQPASCGIPPRAGLSGSLHHQPHLEKTLCF